jgi:hypothetical protein
LQGFFERLVTSLVLIGFLLFGGGALFAVLSLSTVYGSPIEVTIALAGLTLILMGVLAARIFSEVEP